MNESKTENATFNRFRERYFKSQQNVQFLCPSGSGRGVKSFYSSHPGSVNADPSSGAAPHSFIVFWSPWWQVSANQRLKKLGVQESALTGRKTFHSALGNNIGAFLNVVINSVPSGGPTSPYAAPGIQRKKCFQFSFRTSDLLH